MGAFVRRVYYAGLIDVVNELGTSGWILRNQNRRMESFTIRTDDGDVINGP